jgi:acetoin utilization deacetylase AcuC-like enzyme
MPTPLALYYPENHTAHEQPGHPERPQRVEAIRKALEDSGHWAAGRQVVPLELPRELLERIHTPALLQQLEAASQQGANVDADTYLTSASWALTQATAGGAAALAEMVWSRAAEAGFALTRPPGHHAERARAMGFCLLNNIAMAAEHLLAQGAQRLAILDLDVHHGNGSQDIFYERGDVLFISTHQSPLYPGSGHLNERGAGAGKGATCNLPLPPFSGDAAFQAAYEEVAIPLLDRFQPEMLLVSFGFDAHWRDPLANLQVSAAGYGAVVAAMRAWAQAHCGGRIALFLEGGYELGAAAACSLAVTQALLGEEVTDALGPAPKAEGDRWQAVVAMAKEIWEL